RVKLSRSSSEMNLLYQLFVSAIVLCAVAPFVGPIIRAPTAMIYSVFAFQVVAIAAFGFLAWYWLLSIYPVSNMTSFGLLSPIFGVFFGWLIFDDDLTLGFVVAMLTVGAGIVLVNKRTAST
ncbi:MAG: DMT family transporter, partial [Pseudomonadales bacterium]|nr:DMT family transporter [Pseudomonadales bacterium]